MINKETAKQRIKGLLEKYNEVVEEGRFRKYTEEETKKDFIRPMFHALGWDTEDSREVSAEEKISKKKVDYGFRINGIPKFFLEAKPLKANLDDPEFAEQAINYAWHKGCTWAVLSDFDQGVKIFNAEWKTIDLFHSHFKTIPRQEFLDRFEELWALSKEGFEQGLLDKEAEKYGKKSKKTPVSEQLLNDLTKWRAELSKDILWRNRGKHLTEEELDEAVQRIIDRLIFIRNCEDRELEPITLLSTMREWGSKRKGTLAERIVDVFRHFDKEYNSKLFQDHLCDHLDVSNQVLENIIRGLDRTEDGTIRYDFSALDADVLGNVYEQYLGHILKKTAKRVTLTKKHMRRKEQGIYYTPTYIVDYIVRNTLGELLKDEKVDVGKIRVLDLACGSGSFLRKAFDILNEFYSEAGEDYGQTQLDEMGLPFTKKVKILRNNIFGVDLDPRAVEIAQLNLLLKIAEKKHRLPMLQQNIKCGNSLIDDEKIAGDKAFKWEHKFKQIIGEGGFDVVIGNPPYGAKLSKEDKSFMKQKYVGDKTGNTASLFIFRGLELLKEGGYLAYIVPKQLTYIAAWNGIRDRLFGIELVKVIDVSEAFTDVELEQIIFIVKKTKNHSKDVIVGYANKGVIEENTSNKDYFSEERFPLWITDENHSIFDKVLKDTIPLSDVARVNWGAPVAKYLSKTKLDNSIPCLRGREIQRYNMSSEHFIEKKDMVDSYYVKGDKLLFQRIVSRCGPILVANYRDARLNGTYSEEDCYADKTVTMIWDSKIELKLLLGILNSRLISWFAHRYLYNRSQLTMEFMYSYARKFPIRKTYPSDLRDRIIERVDKMLTLNKRLDELGDKRTDERQRIEEEVKKTDAEIDESVYGLYGITESEKKIIESG